MATRNSRGTASKAAPAADPEVTTVEFRGEKFSFPTARRRWPTLAYQAFTHDRHADGVELLFGPVQWERLNQVAPTFGDFWEFFPIFADAAGFAKKA